MRVLVTGHRGHLGTGIARAVVSAGHDVAGFDIRDGDDMLDASAVDAAVGGCRAVIHVALSYGHGRSAFFDVNINGTRNVLESAARHNVDRVVIASSIRALGCWRDGTVRYLPFDDAYEAEPDDDYAAVKQVVEGMARRMSATTGLTTLCIRPPAVYDDDAIARVRARRLEDAEAEWSPRWEFGAWIHADDLSRAFVSALSCDVRGDHAVAFTVAEDINSDRYSCKELVDRFHPGVEWRGGPDYDVDPRRSLVLSRRSLELLDWKPLRRWSQSD